MAALEKLAELGREAIEKGSYLQQIPEMKLVGNAYVGMGQRMQAILVVPEQDVCPYDCDSCHDSDCPCERLGCAGSEAPGAR